LLPQLAQSLLSGVEPHVPGVPHPTQLPQLAEAAQAAHVENAGVPLHEGPVLKMCGGGCAFAVAVAQQMRAAPVQSLSDMHGLGQLLEQTPSQQSWPVAAQSVSDMHDLGHGSYIGLRQRPVADRVVSTLCTEVQHTSPMLVWQSVLVPQLFGHSAPGMQIPCS
jgi:hypothetical protein